jgi:hypothetical protein
MINTHNGSTSQNSDKPDENGSIGYEIKMNREGISVMIHARYYRIAPLNCLRLIMYIRRGIAWAR